MTNFLRHFKKVFTKKADNASYPKISIGYRGEDLEYETQNDSLYISSTWINGRRVYMEYIQFWRSKAIISDLDKSTIFKDVIVFLNNKSKEKSIIVINIDHDKALWESLCEQYKDLIESIEYKSDKENEQFFFDSTLDNILRGGSLIIDNKTIKTERQFLDYWNNRHKR